MGRITVEDINALLPSHKVVGKEYITTCPLCGKKDHFYYSMGEDGESATMCCHYCGAPFLDFVAYFRAVKGEDKSDVRKKYMQKQHLKTTKEPETVDHGKLIEDIGYEYTDVNNVVVYAKRRLKYEDGHKKFCFYHSEEGILKATKPQNIDDKLWNLGCLYTEPDTDILFIVEGEKCASSIINAGYPATTSDTGCGGINPIKFSNNDKYALNRFKRIIIIPDNDEPGQRYIQSIKAIAPKAEVFNLTSIWKECPTKGDIADYLDSGGNMKNIIDTLPEKIDIAPSDIIDYTKAEFYTELSKDDLLKMTHTIVSLPPVDKTFALVWARARAKELKILKTFNDLIIAEELAKREGIATEASDNETNFDVAGSQVKNLRCGDYVANEKGVKRFLPKEKIDINVFYVPVSVVARYKNIDDNNEHVKIAYIEPAEGWQTIECSRRDISDVRQLVALSDMGLPVNSINSKEAVRYFNELINLNPEELLIKKSVSHLGWCGDNVFLPYLNEENIALDNKNNFREIVDGLQSLGSRDESLNMIIKLRQNINFRFCCDAALAGIFLEKTNSLPFLVHLFGGTGAGKTVALLAIMSMFGNPRKLMVSINSTNNALMERAAFLKNFPCALDELQTITDKYLNTDKLIMQLTEGINKQKMVDGRTMRSTGRWRLPFLTNGEQDIVEGNSGGGTLNRVISIECVEPIVQNGHRVVDVIDKNYGFLAENFISYVTDKLPDYIKTYHNIYDDLMTKYNNYHDKQLGIIAIILVIDNIFINCFGTDEQNIQGARLIEKFLRKKEDIDISERAWKYINSIVATNLDNFQKVDDYGKPLKDNAGNTINFYGKSWWGTYCYKTGEVYFLSEVLTSILKEEAYPWSAVKSKWADTGKLIRDRKKYQIYTTRCSRNKAWYVVLNMDFSEEREDDEEPF